MSIDFFSEKTDLFPGLNNLDSIMTVTLLNQAPDVSSLKPRHVQKDTALLISPPLAGHEGPIFGELSVCEE